MLTAFLNRKYMLTALMLPKLENKTQTGTILYIVLLIINCSTYVYNIYIYIYIYTHSVVQNNAYASWIFRANRTSALPPLGVVQNTYRTRTVHYQRIYVFIFFWKIMLNRSLIIILWPICGLLKQIINHNRSKFVLSLLVLTGFAVNISCIHVYTFLCACGVYVYLLCDQISI